MKLKTYNFNKYDKVYVSDGNGGFKSLDKAKLTDDKNKILVVEGDETCHYEWDIDGVAYTEFYVKTDFGWVTKIEPEGEGETVCCWVYNPKTQRGKSFGVDYVDGLLTSMCELHYVIDGKGAMSTQKIVVPPGKYRMEEAKCSGNNFYVKDMEVYDDGEHAGWYTSPILDGERETTKAELVTVGKLEEEALRSLFNGIKTFAMTHNIKLFVDEYNGEIRAAKVPEGYEVKIDEGDYSDMIPWELMPVIGKCDNTMNPDSDYQPLLKKIVKEASNG